MIRCVVFDLDGTLVDMGDLFYRIFADVVRRAGLPDVAFDKCGDPWVCAHRQTLEAYPQLRGVAGTGSFADTWERVLRQMLAEGSLHLYPGARAVLEGIQSSGRAICLASNTPRRFVEIKLDALDIRRFFDAVFTPQDPWGGKPKPDSLMYVMKRFGLTPDEVVMVGDHDQDVVYGKNAGVRTIGVLNEFNSREELLAAEADHIIERVSDVLQILGTMT